MTLELFLIRFQLSDSLFITRCSVVLSCVLNCNEFQVGNLDRTMPSMDTLSWKDALAKALAEEPELWVKTELVSDSVNLPAVSRFQASDKYY